MQRYISRFFSPPKGPFAFLHLNNRKKRFYVLAWLLKLFQKNINNMFFLFKHMKKKKKKYIYICFSSKHSKKPNLISSINKSIMIYHFKGLFIYIHFLLFKSKLFANLTLLFRVPNLDLNDLNIFFPLSFSLLNKTQNQMHENIKCLQNPI